MMIFRELIMSITESRLEYTAVVWLLHLNSHINRVATNMRSSRKELPYEGKLENLMLLMRDRRESKDLIMP